MCIFRQIGVWVLLLCITACNGVSPQIDVICEFDELSNYQIKWDLYPAIEGKVEIFESYNPDLFDTSVSPVVTASILDQQASVVSRSKIARTFFLLRFNNKYEKVVATRSQNFNGVVNFRDMGGYVNKKGQSLRWGMLYRSGCIAVKDKHTANMIGLLNLHTVIDFTPDTELYKSPDGLNVNNIVDIPIPLYKNEEVKKRLEHGEFMRRDAILYMQDVHLDLVENNTEAFKKMFDNLLMANNYPLVMTCPFGKDYTGFAMAMVLYALDMPEDLIMRDYMLSNHYIDKSSFRQGMNAPTNTQEAYTILLKADHRFLGAAINVIRERYGTPLNYLKKELELTPEKIDQLKHILLKEEP